MSPAPEVRRLPARTSTCRQCRRPIVWARTTARDNGPGGRSMPLDPVEDLAGNVEVVPRAAGVLVARVLRTGEQVDRPLNYQAMPHAATCRRPR